MFEMIRQFNKSTQQNQSLIRKALDSSTGVGGALVPQHLEEVITNTIVRLSPEMAMVTPKFDQQKLHEFNKLTTLPAAGGAMGEGAVTPARRSTFQRSNVTLKVIRRKGSVTNFLQDASGKYIDAAAAEMENHLLAHAYDLTTYMLYGNAEANPYEFSGLDHLITTNRVNNARGGAVPTSLNFLDDLIDANEERQGGMHRRAFVMSPQMLSKISQLLTNVRLNQGLSGGGLSQVNIPGGWRMNAYRDIPIIVSSACRPKVQMGTITATSPSTSAGSLSDGTYNFCVAPITYNGEELASANVAITLSGGGSTQNIKLAFTAIDGALSYKIYYGTSATNHTLIEQQSAFTFDANGTITGNNVEITLGSVAATANIPTAQRADVPLVATGGIAPESVFFWDLDEFQGIGRLAYTNTAGSRFNGLVSVEPLAKTDDEMPFLIKTYAALVPSFEATCGMVRNVRVR